MIDLQLMALIPLVEPSQVPTPSSNW